MFPPELFPHLSRVVTAVGRTGRWAPWVAAGVAFATFAGTYFLDAADVQSFALRLLLALGVGAASVPVVWRIALDGPAETDPDVLADQRASLDAGVGLAAPGGRWPTPGRAPRPGGLAEGLSSYEGACSVIVGTIPVGRPEERKATCLETAAAAVRQDDDDDCSSRTVAYLCSEHLQQLFGGLSPKRGPQPPPRSDDGPPA